jgi:hypothetical protein
MSKPACSLRHYSIEQTIRDAFKFIQTGTVFCLNTLIGLVSRIPYQPP